jgi:hypothetical protein
LLEFINERLAVIRFFPSDITAYSAALREAGIKPDTKGRFTISAEIGGWVATYDDGRQHAGWQDLRLAREELEWVSACS